MSDRTCSTIGCYHGREADDKQLSRDLHTQAESVVAQQEGDLQEMHDQSVTVYPATRLGPNSEPCFLLFLPLQSMLSEIGASRMECDYKLVENEGLFQEYLEMGRVTCCILIHVHVYTRICKCSHTSNLHWIGNWQTSFLLSVAVLQFGFITIFVAAFPLAPFFALLVSPPQMSHLPETKIVFP